MSNARVANDDYVTLAGHSLLREAVALLEPERNLLRAGFAQRTAEALRDTMQQAYARLDKGIAKAIETSGLTPACSRGCSWCCRGVKVNVSIPEALTIAEHVMQKVAEKKGADNTPAASTARSSADDDLLSRAHAAAARRRTMTTDDLFQQGDPCPFLGRAGDCQIYDVRPLACRRHCSLNATDCELAVKYPQLKLPVQQHAAANAAGVLSALALDAALQDVGLAYLALELSSAVDVALQLNAAERWLSGEALFDQAVRPVDEADRKTAEADIKGSRKA